MNIKIRACLAEVEKVLEKHDCGGFVVLANEEGGEFKFVNPKWSQLKSKDGAIDIEKTKKGWFSHRSKENWKTEQTIHMLQVIQDATGKGFMFVDNLLRQLKKTINFQGGPRPLEN